MTGVTHPSAPETDVGVTHPSAPETDVQLNRTRVVYLRQGQKQQSLMPIFAN